MSYTFPVDNWIPFALDEFARIAGADPLLASGVSWPSFSVSPLGPAVGERVTYEFKVEKVKAKKVIINKTAVIVLWNDGSKSVAKCHEGDKFDKLMGILVCSLRKASRNRARIDDWEKLLRKICKRVPVGPDGVAGNLRTLADALYLAAGAIEED